MITATSLGGTYCGTAYGTVIDTFYVVRVLQGILNTPSPDTIYGCGSYIDTLNASLVSPLSWVPYTYAWTPSATITSPTNTTLTPIIHPTANTLYTLTVTTAAAYGGCSFTSTVQTVLIASSTTPPSVTSPVNYCQNAPAVPLSSSVVGSNLQWWTVATGGTQLAAAPTPSTATAPATYTWYVNQVTNGCVSPRVPIVVIVSAAPLPTVTSPNSFCQNSTPVSMGNYVTGSNLQWWNTSTGGSQIATPSPSTATAPATYTWYVNQVTGGCSSLRVPVVAIINATPQAPAVVSPLNYCAGDPASPLTAPGSNLLWYSTPTGGTGTSTAPTPNTAVPNAITYYVSQTILGCEGTRAAIIVSVHAIPPPPAVDTVTYCQDATPSPLTAGGPNLLWYTTATGGTGSTTAPVPITTTANSTTYYVSQVVDNCESARVPLEVVIDPRVTASVAFNKFPICVMDTITISNVGSNPGTSTYTWNFVGGTVVSGTGAGPYQVIWTTPGVKDVSVTVSNLSCSATANKEIEVLPIPDAAFFIKPDACLDEIVSVQPAWNQIGSLSYTWNFGDGTILNGSSNGASAYQVKWNTTGIKTIELIAHNAGCPSLPYYDTVLVHPNPMALIETPSQPGGICLGDEIMISARYDNSGLVYNYLWTPEQFFNSNGAQHALAVLRAERYIHLVVSDQWGCNSSDSLLVNAKPCCDVYLPNAFSPNGDGSNDVFRAITSGHHELSVFRILNRWGQVVFQTADEKVGWDGTMNGEPQPMATYFYIMKYRCMDGKMIEKKGEVILVR